MIDGIPAPPCVQCGYCCKVGVCRHGKWNAESSQCAFLAEDGKCDKYEEIKDDPLIGFGLGCSSSLCNPRRQKKLMEMKK